jgi:hypothetical protein
MLVKTTQSSTPMTFPHLELTPIVGTPTNPTIQTLQKQLYANALAIHSTHGGAANGHLTVLMPNDAFVNCTGVVFVTPIHPDNAPVHALNSTGNQIIKVNHQSKQDLQAFQFFQHRKLHSNNNCSLQ